MAFVIHRAKQSTLPIFSQLLLAFFIAGTAMAEGWWKPEWTQRTKITIDTGTSGVPFTADPGTAAVLVRLDSNFGFSSAKEDGSDIRFVASDDKTVLEHHIERWNSQTYEAFVWVNVPGIKAGAATSFWLYFGNGEAARSGNPKGTYDADIVGAYHFSESGAPADSSASAANAETAGVPIDASLIAGGMNFIGTNAVTLPAAAPLAWVAGGSMTWSAWVKASTLRPNAILFSRRSETAAFLIGQDNGIPFVEVTSNGATQRSVASAPVAVNTWHHLAVVATGATITVFLDGSSYATANASLPALNGIALLGKDGPPGPAEAIGFTGEVDELQISKVARTPEALKFAAINQGPSADAVKLVVLGQNESNAASHSTAGEIAKHLTLFVTISKDLTFDGWIVIGLCALLSIVGGAVAVSKFLYLNKIKKASTLFMRQWKNISGDITSLDHASEESIKSMGGTTGSQQTLMRRSPLFHLYHSGSQEIQKRIDSAEGRFGGLSGRSITAIKAVLDGGVIKEIQRLNDKLIFLTIGIAGGPYLGLLGTVIGVMITFAVIAQSGEVEINSIAPGIAGALLATVAGLAVAIPALFAYSYLSTRIKEAVNGMHSFVDEFIARIAEAYPTSNE